MKVLVIDDSALNRKSAWDSLQEHDLTVVGSYDEAHELVGYGQQWDVVLCDLLMPAGKRAMGPEGQKFIGQEMPVGFALALMAALRGAKYVAVVTAKNHHNHPASALLDEFRSYCPHKYAPDGQAPRFTINGARVGFYQGPYSSETGKGWAQILRHLVDPDAEWEDEGDN